MHLEKNNRSYQKMKKKKRKNLEKTTLIGGLEEIIMASRTKSTFEREMQDSVFRERFKKEYSEFLLSELITALMENDNKSVRKLAAEVGLSPTVIQKLRSGKQQDIKLKNFVSISNACGYHLFLEKRRQRISIF